MDYLIRKMQCFTENIYLCLAGDIVLCWLLPKTQQDYF